MRLPRKDPAWWFAVSWVFGFPVVALLVGIGWVASSCNGQPVEQVANCQAMLWLAVIMFAGVAWLVGVAIIAIRLAISNRKRRTE